MTEIIKDTPYNSISSGQNVQVVINGIRGKLAKQAIDAVGIAFLYRKWNIYKKVYPRQVLIQYHLVQQNTHLQ